MPSAGTKMKFDASHVPNILEQALQFMLDNEPNIGCAYTRTVCQQFNLSGISLSKEEQLRHLKNIAANHSLCANPAAAAPAALRPTPSALSAGLAFSQPPVSTAVQQPAAVLSGGEQVRMQMAHVSCAATCTT